MEQEIKLSPLLMLAIGQSCALLILIIGKMIDWFSGKSKDNTRAIQENTVAVTKLQVEMVHIGKALDAIPKLQQDVSAAHNKIRSLEKNTLQKAGLGNET